MLPYSNQQFSSTFGGPIRRDRIHYFANYEYEREPQTITFDSPYPEFNIDYPNTRSQHSGGGKGDLQFSPQIRLSARLQVYDQVYYAQGAGGGSVNHPSNTQYENRHTTQFLTTFTQVIGSRALNEIRGGTSRFTRLNEPVTRWAGGNFPNASTYSLRTGTATRVQMRGYSFGAGNVQHHNQYKSSIRDDFSVSLNKAGRHALRLGGEYIYDLSILRGCGSTCRPTLVAQGGAVPANITQVIPVWNDASTWNLDLLSPISQRYELSITETAEFYREIPQHLFAGWIQDDWTISSQLTLNLGLRWDMETGVGAKLALPPILPGDNPEDKNNFGPRVGFAYAVNPRTVVRGGYGMFFAEGTADEYHQTQLFIMSIAPQVLSDGRSNFPSNPYNGPAPTLDQLLARSCDLNGSQPGCVRREFVPEMVDPFFETPYSHQASIGVQRQLGTNMSFESNYVYTAGRLEEDFRNVNLNYNAATGANYDYRDVSRLPMPQLGRIQLTSFQAWSDYHGWESSFTRRMSNRWQASATYTLSRFKDSDSPAFAHAIPVDRLTRQPLGFDVQPDLGTRVHDRGHRSAPSRGPERHLGRRLRPATERPVFLRIRRAAQHQLRRRPAQRRGRDVGPPASRRHGCTAEQPGRRSAPPRRPAPAAPDSPRRRADARRHGGSVQRVQPGELRVVYDAGEQRDVRTADVQQQHRIPIAVGAVRLPLRVLRGGVFGLRASGSGVRLRAPEADL